MKKASAIVTDKGGRTCHAAIVAKNWELQQCWIIKCNSSTKDDQMLTVSCCRRCWNCI